MKHADPRDDMPDVSGILPRQVGKRALDLFLTFPALCVLSPLLILIAVILRLFLGSSIIFQQDRPGINGIPFRLYKFRTMTEARDAEGNLLPDGQRLTRFGRFLRRYSLDELPGLANVIKGDLSLVGPRPLLMKYLPYFSEKEKLRFSVKPGVTGWAQIHGRNYVPWDERLALDVWYVQNWSFRLDLEILAKTIVMVLKKEGVSANPDLAETDLDEERRRQVPVT